jgi:multidrug efflux pump subunit AcrA (membrane-fusion protein)
MLVTDAKTKLFPELPAIRRVPPSGFAQRFMRGLRSAIVVLPMALYFTPWQQSIHGYGRVEAFDPNLRPQIIKSPIDKARVKKTHVIENQVVEKDQVLMDLVNVFEDLLTNLENQAERAREKVELTRDKALAYQRVVDAMKSAAKEAIRAMDFKLESQEFKIEEAEARLREAEAKKFQTELDNERRAILKKDGLASNFEAEVAEQRYKVDSEGVAAAKAGLEGAKQDLESLKAEREMILREYDGKIDKAVAERQQADGEVRIAEKELLVAQAKLEEQQQQTIKAPFDGIIQRVHAMPGSTVLKQGDPLLTIVPLSEEICVELFVDGNDASLISVGREARLQFEGFPGFQFSGWPSVAIGTFGGEVVQVDAADDGKGRFRIRVLPKEDGSRIYPKWPNVKYLRQGNRASGWVLLDQVNLGWEFWRVLNGFPPVIDVDEKEDIKVPTVPK